MLEDLVAGLPRPSAPDVSGPGAVERGGVLAHVVPPDVLNGTRPAAVDALGLGGPDDGVLQRRAGLEDEDGGGLVLVDLALAVAGAALAVEQRHLPVEDGVGRDDGGRGERRAAGGRRPLRVDGRVGAGHAAGGLPLDGARCRLSRRSRPGLGVDQRHGQCQHRDHRKLHVDVCAAGRSRIMIYVG